MKRDQDYIKRILVIKHIEFEEIDVGDPLNHDSKLFMQETLKLDDEDFKALAPQIFNEKKHRGVRDILS